MIEVFVALGANLGEPLLQVQRAVADICRFPTTKVTRQSSWYRSRPIGPGLQDDYINGVVAINTLLEAEQLLAYMQRLEQHYGRDKTVRWGPRHLDLDILLYGSDRHDSERLQIPHPMLEKRNFVLIPLHEIAPALSLPSGLTLASLVAQISWEGLDRLPAGPLLTDADLYG